MFGMQTLSLRMFWMAVWDAWTNPFDIERTELAPLERD